MFCVCTVQVFLVLTTLVPFQYASKSKDSPGSWVYCRYDLWNNTVELSAFLSIIGKVFETLAFFKLGFMMMMMMIIIIILNPQAQSRR